MRSAVTNQSLSTAGSGTTAFFYEHTYIHTMHTHMHTDRQTDLLELGTSLDWWTVFLSVPSLTLVWVLLNHTFSTSALSFKL